MKKYQEFEINYYQDEDGVFTAQVPAIRGCIASGRTLELTIPVPRHPGDVPIGTLRAIVREMGITVAEFNAL
ncbi:MAG: hypothetical protein HY897_20190 [Deltaproteobacteria bacterium]|nr:hypothetical protein [Deltaproteobacteria bacterium]